jgi:cytochrome c-type biogenesis protein
MITYSSYQQSKHMVDPTIISAFIAGIISFFSPCVLPLLPGFLVHISQIGLDPQSPPSKIKIFINSCLYVLGFSTVFATLGVLFNAIIPTQSYQVQTYLSWIGGAVIIFFGLFATGLIKASWLQQNHQFFRPKAARNGYVSAFIFGAAFAIGWSPCVGAILGAVLTLAATSPGMAFNLLLAYSLGIGIPFLFMGAFAAHATPLLRRIAPRLELIQKIAGWLLIIFGILIATQTLPRLFIVGV